MPRRSAEPDWDAAFVAAGRDAQRIAYERVRARDLPLAAWRSVTSVREAVLDSALSRRASKLMDDGSTLTAAWSQAAQEFGLNGESVLRQMQRDRRDAA